MRVLLFFVALLLVISVIFASAHMNQQHHEGKKMHAPRRQHLFQSKKDRQQFMKAQHLLKQDVARHRGVSERSRNGELAWKTYIGQPVYSSPTSTYDTLYVGSDDNAFYALNSDYGHIVYNIYTNGPIKSAASICYECGKDEGRIFFGSNDKKLRALGLDEGYLQWEFNTNGSIYSRPFVLEQNSQTSIIFGSFDKNVYSINDQGSLNWKFSTDGAVSASAQVFNGNIFIGSWDNSVYSLRPTDGGLNFKVKLSGIVASACLFDQPNVFCATMKGGVHAFDYTTGVEAWTVMLPISPKNPSATPSVSGRMALLGSTLYVGAGNGIMYAINTANGQIQFTYDAQDPITNGIALLDERIYFGAGSHLIALNANNGTESFRFKTDGKVTTRPLVEDKAFVGDDSGNVYAVHIY